jgi:exopolyphosphatase/pppGpp-phosphohydrolase
LSDPSDSQGLDLSAIPAQRAEILPSGTLILLFVMELWGIAEISVSTRGLRHGVILDLADSKPRG